MLPMLNRYLQWTGGAILALFLLCAASPLLPKEGYGVVAGVAHAATDSDKYVRTANYYLLSGPALDKASDSLALYDLLILPAEAQVYNPTFFSSIRKKNSDIILLAYVPTVSWNNAFWNDPLHLKMKRGIDHTWWLRDGNGSLKSVWPNTSALNLKSGWVPYLASFVSDEILSTGLWDGVFYDEVQDSIDWVGSVDTDGDGTDDKPTVANAHWENGFMNLFKTTRDRIGTAKFIIINGSSRSVFTPYVNGRMFETFPSSGNSTTYWTTALKEYQRLQTTAGYLPINILNVNTENSGERAQYQKVRFGLTTTLLGNGYFSFDHGTHDHAQLWTYDEYQVYLGRPKTDATNNGNGIWERDFEKGKVLLNATSVATTIRLDGEYEKIHGIQTFLNGSFIRVFTVKGDTKRTGFFTYDNAQKGGVRMIYTDLTGDGVRETIVADQTFITVLSSDGRSTVRFAPYGESYRSGINVAVGDMDKDGKKEIVTGTEKGGGPHVRIFAASGVPLQTNFFAFDPKSRAGVKITLGDVDGDGALDIIAGSGPGGAPAVRVYRTDGKQLGGEFMAYDKKFRGGVNVAAGDVDGDGTDEIITGPGVGGGPHVRVFTKDGKLKAQFYTFDAKDNKGAEVVAADIDGDGTDEIIGLTTDVFTLSSY
ncbi:MAG: hypothetical protein UY77_C0041G0009 [Candidatus Uhrbacteria bacterium GW2011_GWA2_53_10]|uniref:FG-GAP repeat protein n=1 Tax=Candidatus Uhrbacteria bacterium GW2011_GWA2_53_10 TaxID=1618980 RepID=A0A0G1XM18_9BACT|nr:MAG: hypothetical protein UY77_C0041G0009 [Candidatus Uhrbacteria bacterium GW2011_GWA2_53_10]